MPAFIQAQLAPDVEPPAPAPGPPPQWMPSRLAAIGAFKAAFDAFEPAWVGLQAATLPRQPTSAPDHKLLWADPPPGGEDVVLSTSSLP
jgi:hypothetical protein